MSRIDAAGAGKHIILEKPMALTLAECDAIIAAVDRANVYLIVGHTHGFDPAVRAMQRMVAERELGPLGMIAAWNYTNFLYRPRRPEELDTAQGGGILFNQVPHQVDMVRTIGGGRLTSVRAQAAACRIVAKANIPMVIDADALNAVAVDPAALRVRYAAGLPPAVLTPLSCWRGDAMSRNRFRTRRSTAWSMP